MAARHDGLLIGFHRDRLASLSYYPQSRINQFALRIGHRAKDERCAGIPMRAKDVLRIIESRIDLLDFNPERGK